MKKTKEKKLKIKKVKPADRKKKAGPGECMVTGRTF